MKWISWTQMAFVTMALLGACTSSQVNLGGDDGGRDAATSDAGRADAGETTPCGDNNCVGGEYCCNESCGICAALGSGCPAIVCEPEPFICNGVVCEEGVTSCCAGCGPGESTCGPSDGSECLPPPCPPPETCPDGTECGADGICCLASCDGDYSCGSPDGPSCPLLDCPPPPRCEDGTTCGAGEQCCPGCAGEFCAPIGGSCPRPACPPPPDRCEAMDARGEGPCDAILGVAFDGESCVYLSGCSCVGDHCPYVHDSVEACESANWNCGITTCMADKDCAVSDYCDECATSSCPGCEDCVGACVPHSCLTEPAPTCRAERPDCADGEVAVVRDGCWECTELARCGVPGCAAILCGPGTTCQECDGDAACVPDGEMCPPPSDPCALIDCEDGHTCTVCRPGEGVCLAPDEVCAF